MNGREQVTGPVAAATTSLVAWIEGADLRVAVSPPDAGPSEPGLVRAWPVALLPELELRGAAGTGTRWLRVRFLLTADGDQAQASAQFDRLLVASLDAPAVRVVVEPVAVEFWRAFDLPPRLGFYADVPAQVVRARPVQPPVRVRSGIRVDDSPLSAIHGIVRGPGGVSIPGMRVVALDSDATTYTDNRGRFAFAALPADRPARLLVSGKGVTFVTEAAPSAEPVVINCEMEE